jgi:hypothetical protein
MASSTTDWGSLISTALIFGLVTAAAYWIFIRPFLPNTANRPAANDNARTPVEQGSKKVTLRPCDRAPPHLAHTSLSTTAYGGTNVLIDGLLAFRHCAASGYERRLYKDSTDATDSAALARQDRAKILARLVEPSENDQSPPSKGSTVVIAVAYDELGSQDLDRVLFLLATYYNLLLLVNVPSTYSAAADRSSLLKRIRQGDSTFQPTLVAEVLPDHRIVPCTAIASRVAFVRQVGKVDIVVDYEAAVREQLTRFGYRVLFYGSSDASDAPSRLGSFLLS